MPRKQDETNADAKPKRKASAKPKAKPAVSRQSRVRSTSRGGRGR